MEDEKKQVDVLKKKQILSEEFENGDYSEEKILQAPILSKLVYFFLLSLFIAFTSCLFAGLGAYLISLGPPNGPLLLFGLVGGLTVGYKLSKSVCTYLTMRTLNALHSERKDMAILGTKLGMLPGGVVGFFVEIPVYRQFGMELADTPFIMSVIFISLVSGIIAAIIGVTYLYLQDDKIKNSIVEKFNEWTASKNEPI